MENENKPAEPVKSSTEKELEVGTVTVQNISKGSDGPLSQHPNDVQFKVKYVKGYDGPKPWEEDSIQIISKESAEQFTKNGMGSIVKK